TEFRVAQLFASREGRNVAEPLQPIMNLLESLPSNEKVHILGKAPIPVEKERHGAGKRIGDTEFFKPPGDLFQGLVDRTFSLEVPAALLYCPPQVLAKMLFVCRHGAPQS